MAKIHINITDELRKKLQQRARDENRSMTEHVNFLVIQDVDMASIPIVGTIGDDGLVSFRARERKWSGGHADYIRDFPNTIDPRD